MKRKIENEAQPYQTHAGDHRRSHFFGDPILHEVRTCSAQSGTCFLVVFADLHAGTPDLHFAWASKEVVRCKAAGRAGAGVHFPVHPFYSDQSIVDAEQHVHL
jgi:hypothetical protein